MLAEESFLRRVTYVKLYQAIPFVSYETLELHVAYGPSLRNVYFIWKDFLVKGKRLFMKNVVKISDIIEQARQNLTNSTNNVKI